MAREAEAGAAPAVAVAERVAADMVEEAAAEAPVALVAAPVVEVDMVATWALAVGALREGAAAENGCLQVRK